MPTVKVERLRNDGPFHVGDRYEVVPDGSSEHVSGVIVGVRPTGPKHVTTAPATTVCAGTYQHVMVELEDKPRIAAEDAIRAARMDASGRIVDASSGGTH